MQLPVLRGVIERRLLVNFRVRPDVLARLVPAPLRPQRVRGWGVAGICLIRLAGIGPTFLPRGWGFASENAAHRMAVEWDEAGQTRTGVYIPRRETSSRLNALLGGRLFPGVHHLARFRRHERSNRYRVELTSRDAKTRLLVEGRETADWPGDSVFPSLEAASEFFRQGSLGYSDSARPGVLDGLELRCRDWKMTPFEVNLIESSYFADRRRFPPESVRFDSALLMTQIEHEWRGRAPLHGRHDRAEGG